MKNIFIVLLSLHLLCNLPETLASKRIKRKAETERNHTKLSKDFVVLQAKAKPDVKDNKKIANVTGETNSLYDTFLHSLKDATTDVRKVVKVIGPKIHRRDENTVASTPAYWWRKRERNSTHDPLVTSPKTSVPESVGFSRKKDSTFDAMRDIPNLLHGKGTANIIGAHVVLPSQSLAAYPSLTPFVPIDQMMRYANMLLYKMGVDAMSAPSQYTRMSPLRIENLQPKDVTIYNMDNLNSVESTASHHDHKTSSDTLPYNSKGHSGMMIYSRPWFFKTPVVAKESEEFIDLFENALDNGPADKESVLQCPLHHNKKNLKDDQCGNSDEDDKNNEGIIQVCSCHFIKKNKENPNSEYK